MKKLSPPLKDEAIKNTTVSIKSGGVEDTVKQGVPNDHSRKHDLPEHSTDRIGMSIGVTKNMGDFESLRVDTWITVSKEKSETYEETYDRVRELLGKVLSETVEEYLPD